MPRSLHRSYGAQHLHLITCSCYRRLPLLRTARSRDRFLSILEQTRERYRFVVVGYVVMPEHVHLLITEPEVGTPVHGDASIKAADDPGFIAEKKRADGRRRRYLSMRFSAHRSGRTTKKRVEKLRYMHRNPVKRGLVESPEERRWSSFRFYLLDEVGLVRMNAGWTKISSRAPASVMNPPRTLGVHFVPTSKITLTSGGTASVHNSYL